MNVRNRDLSGETVRHGTVVIVSVRELMEASVRRGSVVNVRERSAWRQLLKWQFG